MKISSRFTLILVDHQNLVRIKYPISRKLIEEQIPSLLSCIPQSRFAAKWTLVFTWKILWVFNIRLFLNFSSSNFSKETLKEVQPMARAYMSNFLLHLILLVALFFLATTIWYFSIFNVLSFTATFYSTSFASIFSASTATSPSINVNQRNFCSIFTFVSFFIYTSKLFLVYNLN